MKCHDIDSAIESLTGDGEEHDWDIIQEGEKIPLPTYPFQRQRHWAKQAIADRRKSERIAHPLLEKQINVANDIVLLTGQLDHRKISYLNDLKIDSKSIYPSACFFEMCIASAIQVTGVKSFKLTNVICDSIFSMEKEQYYETQTILTTLNQSDFNIEIYTRSGAKMDIKWMQYSQAGFNTSYKHEKKKIETYPKLSGDEVEIPRDKFYHGIDQTEIKYETSYQGLQDIFIKDNTAFGEVDVKLNTDDYHYHPVLLTSCFDLVYAFLQHNNNGIDLSNSLFPVSCQEVIVFESLNYWAKAQMKLKRFDDNEDILTDLIIYDEIAEPAVIFKNLRFRSLYTIIAQGRTKGEQK